MTQWNIRLSHLLFAAAWLSVLFFSRQTVHAQDNSPDVAGTFVSSNCMFEGIDLGLTTLTGEALGFECGYVIVPERHDSPNGPTLRIPVAVRKATSADARPDPLLLAQGGPGGDAFEIFSLLVPNTDIAANRDIVIFNQRGTPYAEPELSCQETDEALAAILAATDEEGERIYTEAIEACYRRLLAEGIDLSAFNSLENAADVPVVARALGYNEYNFYGVSYGTLLGLHLMRNHPEGLRAVILDSVVSPDVNFISEIPKSEDRVFREIFAACAADDECNRLYPGLEERFYAVVRQFDENPVTLTLVDPKTGDKYDAYLSGAGLRSVLYQLLYLPRMNAVLPKVISDLEKGDTTYIRSMWPLLAFDQLVAEGMYYSVVCAEDADIDLNDIPIDSLRPEIAEKARDDIRSYIDTCALWNVEQLPPSVDEPVISDIPVMLLSGRFDPITPPAFAEAAAAGLSNSYTVVDDNASHGVAFLSPCVNRIIVEFLDNPQQQPDTGCLLAQESARVVPPDAITLPLLAGINSLERRTLILFGIAGLLLMVILSPFVVWPAVYLIRALTDRQPAIPPGERRLRWGSRIALLAFGALAFVFALGLLAFIGITIVRDQTMLTALALPATAAPVLWIPFFLLIIIGIAVVLAIALWRRSGAGSVPGKIYYSLVVAAAIAFVVLLGTQNLLLPPI